MSGSLVSRIAPLAALCALTSPGAHAQSGPETTLAPIVVTAAGYEQEIEDAPASISVITREELQKGAFRDLTDAMRNVEGVSVTGTSNEKEIYIRGLGGGYVLILVDGKRQSTRDARVNGNAGFEQSFVPPLEAIERIEVVRGPMSSLYGSDAMGGVINIITRKVSETWGGSSSLDYIAQEYDNSGDSHQQQFYLQGPVKADLVGLQLWGRNYERSEDNVLNGFNAARDRNLTARLAITPNENHDILLEAGTTTVRRKSSPGGTLVNTALPGYNDNDREHYSLSHTGRSSWAISEMSLSREVAQRENYSGSRSGGYTRNPRAPEIENTVFDARITLPWADHFVVVGGQWNEGNLTDQNPGRRTNVDEQFSITQRALFVEDEWAITDGLALTGGLRLDDHEVYGAHWSPRVYAVWRSSDTMTFKGGVSRGFRAPDIRTIAPGYAYTNGGPNCTYGPNGTCGVLIGDPDLKPETSTSYEVAAFWNSNAGLSASATAFYTDFRDKVANALVYNADGTIARWSEDPNFRLWYNYNIGQATIAGVELSGRWQATRALALKTGYTFTDSEQEGGDFDGYPLARTPRHMFNLRADWVVMPKLTLWSALNHHGKEINASIRAGNNGTLIASGVREYDSYDILDIGASLVVMKNSTVHMAIYNVNDKRLDEVTYNTVGDGRRLWVSLNVGF